MRPWLGGRTLERLNGLVSTESGKPVQFVPPRKKHAYYEIKVYETGEVETRPENWHDYFNALAWLAFPSTKARINAMHAAEMPKEGTRRGPLRDLLTIFDEGGAIVHCDDASLVSLLESFQWRRLFWDNRSAVQAGMRLTVFGHAVLEKALEPWPGITCKAIVVPAAAEPDSAAVAWLERLAPGASPRVLSPLPIFGFPGWHAATAQAQFYDDSRYFRPLAR